MKSTTFSRPGLIVDAARGGVELPGRHVAEDRREAGVLVLDLEAEVLGDRVQHVDVVAGDVGGLALVEGRVGGVDAR